MTRTMFALLVTAAAAAGCDSAPTTPQQVSPGPALAREGSPVNENSRSDFAREIMNPCPPVPELVAVKGWVQYNSHFKFSEDANTSRLKWLTNASGIGLVTGARYKLHEIINLEGRFTYVDNVWVTERSSRLHLISQTGLGNFFATMRWNVRCTEEGCKDEIISFETDCRG